MESSTLQVEGLSESNRRIVIWSPARLKYQCKTMVQESKTKTNLLCLGSQAMCTRKTTLREQDQVSPSVKRSVLSWGQKQGSVVLMEEEVYSTLELALTWQGTLLRRREKHRMCIPARMLTRTGHMRTWWKMRNKKKCDSISKRQIKTMRMNFTPRMDLHQDLDLDTHINNSYLRSLLNE